MSRTACRCGVRVGTALGFGLLLVATLAGAEGPAGFDAARAFGARQSVLDLSLSPDGTRVAYIAPAKEQGTVLVTGRLEARFKGTPVMLSDGKPYRLRSCNWVSNQRLVCQVYGIIADNLGNAGLLPVSRWLAVNADGSNVQTLATRRNTYSRGYPLHDGDIIDYLPGEDGAVLMSRVYTPDTHTNSHIGSDKEGLGVDRVDTGNLAVRSVIPPSRNVFEYLSDGRGTVRIMGMAEQAAGYLSGKLAYYYRAVGSTDWHPLSQYDERDRSGFRPVAVDHDLNVAYGFRRLDGRSALYTIRLDESLQEQLIYSRPDVDVSSVFRIGRRQRVVAAGYITDRSHVEVFDPQIRELLAALSRALPQQQLRVTDSTEDESKLLIFAGSDTDPGVYYLFDRKSHQLATFLVVRDDLEGVKLAKVKAVTYPADDGVMVPGYLTLPPGKENAHSLPAIVLPHGGPESRDQWGFDWLPQFFANRGYAVLQPEFRGSTGYGDAWFEQNGYHSWRAAIGDVVAAGHWLVTQGIADPARLGIVGWSYGGYAALQSNVVDPALFKAVVAIAPVTDLNAHAEEWRRWSNFELEKERLGEGSEAREASPIEHASGFKAPVLLFHGTNDRNVGYEESASMADKLRSAGKQVELVTFKDLDHQLDDSAARQQLLARSDEFLQAAFRGSSATH
ncbi:MAG TPA: alpha/beta fold hydrolase [Steroidobacteraceae bacterium]|jgi:dienelactone hydrolase|nr:alpha/beta fold hydrolase [Steroidobacteraceae bacterium]